MVAVDGNHGRRKDVLMSFQRLGIVLARLIAEPEKLQASADESARTNGGGDRLNPAGEERDGSRPPAHDREDARMGKGKEPEPESSGQVVVHGYRNPGKIPGLPTTGKCGPAVVRRSTGSPCPAAGPHLLA